MDSGSKEREIRGDGGIGRTGGQEEREGVCVSPRREERRGTRRGGRASDGENGRWLRGRREIKRRKRGRWNYKKRKKKKQEREGGSKGREKGRGNERTLRRDREEDVRRGGGEREREIS